MDTKTRKIVGDNVKRLRKLRGWKQGDLSRHTGSVEQTTISSVERGVKAATIDTLSDIAAALGVPVWVLMVPAEQMSIEDLRNLGALVNSYIATSQEGQAQICRVAEAEERYSRAS